MLLLVTTLSLTFTACGDDDDELNPNEQTSNQENDPNTYVGRYEGKAYIKSIPSLDRDLMITLQINSDKSGYYMESHQDGCKSYFYFDDIDFYNGYLWGIYGENQERCLGKYESNNPQEICMTLESTGYYLTCCLVRESLANDTNKYHDVSSSGCGHNFEAGNLFGYWYFYASDEGHGYGSTNWWMALKEDNTFVYRRNQDIRRGSYTVSGHTIRLYFEEGTYTPYNIQYTTTTTMMLENGKKQYGFTRISEADFKRFVSI